MPIQNKNHQYNLTQYIFLMMAYISSILHLFEQKKMYKGEHFCVYGFVDMYWSDFLKVTTLPSGNCNRVVLGDPSPSEGGERVGW